MVTVTRKHEEPSKKALSPPYGLTLYIYYFKPYKLPFQLVENDQILALSYDSAPYKAHKETNDSHLWSSTVRGKK